MFLHEPSSGSCTRSARGRASVQPCEHLLRVCVCVCVYACSHSLLECDLTEHTHTCPKYIYTGTRVQLSSVGCNFSLLDASCTFNYESPCKGYRLDLSNSFDRACAFALLQIGACHQTYIIAHATLNGSGMYIVYVFVCVCCASRHVFGKDLLVCVCRLVVGSVHIFYLIH
jgi:hypothetical protein